MICVQSWTKSGATKPYLDAERISWATLAAFNKVLLGTQPCHVQSPPSGESETSNVLAPKTADIPAAVSPAAPPPIATKSKSGFKRNAPPPPPASAPCVPSTMHRNPIAQR